MSKQIVISPGATDRSVRELFMAAWPNIALEIFRPDGNFYRGDTYSSGLNDDDVVSRSFRLVDPPVEAMAEVPSTPEPAADLFLMLVQPRDDLGYPVSLQLAHPVACPPDLLGIEADLARITATRSVGARLMACDKPLGDPPPERSRSQSEPLRRLI
jgi:hypothetical protein